MQMKLILREITFKTYLSAFLFSQSNKENDWGVSAYQ